MTQQHFISMIIPVHNAAGTLEAAVGSVLAQTFSDFELILVDDGGTDGSPLLCDALAGTDPRIRVFHMEDRGVSAARNLGLDAARGERIAFLDADDVLHPSILQVLSDLLDETGADYAGCGFGKRHDGERPFAEGSAGAAGAEGPADRGHETLPEAENGAPHGSASPYSVAADSTLPDRAAPGTETASALPHGSVTTLCGAQIITEGTLHPAHPDTRVWSKLFCREYIGTTRFREGLTIGEDMLFLVELARPDARYVQIPDELYSYYINPHGAMERPFAPNHMDTIRCRELAEDVIRREFPSVAESPDGAARLAAQQLIAAVLTASKIARLPSGQQSQYAAEFERCRDTLRRYHRVKGASGYLPQGYALKIRMLLHTPGVYRRLYR